jgi:DNA topoisomerase-3
MSKGDKFKPSQISMSESETKPPNLLTEADLISKMDQNGIGTDATIHEHIKNIQERGYCGK